jgi:pyrimidine-specific ribonucleoside hydrolase
MNVKVELKDEHTRGMTVCDYRHIQGTGADINGVSAIIRGDKPNCEVAMDMDVGGFFKLPNDTIAMYN